LSLKAQYDEKSLELVKKHQAELASEKAAAEQTAESLR